MKRGIILTAVAAFACAAYFTTAGGQTAPATSTSVEDPALAELDARISKTLSQTNTLSEANTAMVAELWKEYKAAWLKNEPNQNYEGYGTSPTPDVKDFSDYLGVYAMGRPATGPSSRPARTLEVTQDVRGRFVVKLQGHSIPALCWNKSILFTTGDIVISRNMPSLGEKRHRELEFITIVRVGGKYYAAPIGSRDLEKEALTLTKVDPSSAPAK